MPVMIWRAPMVRVRDGRSCRWPMSRFPGGGAVFPSESVVLWTHDPHDAVADEGHGCEVFPTSGCE
jgi:hypothetical protein